MKVGIVGDVHAPACHVGYLQFCQDIFDAWGVRKIVMIGDVVDHHAISFHARNPNCPGPSDEYELTLQEIGKWYKAFPKADVMIGNHDERVFRLAESVNIPSFYMRDYGEVWKTPGWSWMDETIIDNVNYLHGTGKSGMHPAYNHAKNCCMSVVMGHVHTAGGYKWIVGPRSRHFGMDTGCGVDDKSMQMAYGKHFAKKSVLSCSVVIDGHPYHEMMPCGPGERYHRNKFKPRQRSHR